MSDERSEHEKLVEDAARLVEPEAWGVRATLDSHAEQFREAVLARTREIAELREALTPSGATKADYIGEFKFTAYDADEAEVSVPWPTIKQIMARILARAERSVLRAKENPNG